MTQAQQKVLSKRRRCEVSARGASCPPTLEDAKMSVDTGIKELAQFQVVTSAVQAGCFDSELQAAAMSTPVGAVMNTGIVQDALQATVAAAAPQAQDAIIPACG